MRGFGDVKPLAIDLYAGLGGWAEGLLAEGFRVVGFDNERRPYPGRLVLQDVLTLHGSQFRDAAVIVASPPCQQFSKRAMPFKDGKAQTPKQLGVRTPDWWSKTELPKRFKRAEDAMLAYASGQVMNPVEMREWQAWKKRYPVTPPERALFDACFRIQREAMVATIKTCPVCQGAPYKPGNYCKPCNGSGTTAARYIPLIVENVRGAQPWVGRSAWNYGSFHLWGDVPALMPITFRSVMKHGVTHRSDGIKQLNPRGDNATAGRNRMGLGGVKVPSQVHGTEYAFTRTGANGQTVLGTRKGETKMETAGSGKNYGGDFGWDGSAMRTGNSHSNARKAASAMIAKIPFELARHIAAVYYPRSLAQIGRLAAAAGKS